jgi:hypothetical protein
MENLIFMTESNKGTNDEVESSSRSLQHASMEALSDVESRGAATDPDFEPSSLQRPVDLYKVAYVSYLNVLGDGNGYKPAGFCYPKPVPVKNIYTH